MKVKDLRPNKKNPRKISDKKLDSLRASIEKFGDLSGFVYNKRTDQLVSGHQRSKTLPPDAKITIEVKHENPTAAFTVAEGYVLVGDERFKYREVDAPIEWEVEALLAANKHGGEWDRDMLALNLADFPNIDLRVTGFEVAELKAMNIDYNPMSLAAPVYNPPEPEAQKESYGGMGEDQEESDEQYIKNNPGPDQEAERERLPDLINRTPNENPHAEPAPVTDITPGEEPNPFESVNETTTVEGRRVVIIVDCDGDDELKKELKEKVRAAIDGTKAKLF